MAVVSTIVTHNATSAAANLAEGSLFRGGKVKTIPFSFAVASGDSDGSVYPFAELPVNARIRSITIKNDEITAGTGYDLGAYQVKNGSELGDAVDDDCLAAAIDMSSARTTSPSIVMPNVEDIGKKLWELAGLSAQPVYSTMLLAFTADTVGSADGDIGGFVEYVEN
jgi:hypothetical protein